MKRIWICLSAVLALLAVSTILLRSRSQAIQQEVGSVGLSPTMEMQTAKGAYKLPIEDVEDMSLVYPSAPKR
jgi:hypothetical protein